MVARHQLYRAPHTVLPIPCSPYRTPHNPVDLEAKSRQSGCHRLTQEIAGNYKILFNFAVNFHNPFSHAYRRIRTAEFWVMRTPQTPYQQVCKRFRQTGDNICGRIRFAVNILTSLL